MVRRPPARLAVLLAPLAASCALSAPPAEQTLAHAAFAGGERDGAASALLRDADRAQQDLDARAAAALGAARDDPSADAQLAATALLFSAADLRLQRATLAWLDAHPDADLAAVLFADDALPAAPQQEILSLCTAGLEMADLAAAHAPDRPAARLHQGLHVSLIAWANGPARSLFAGYGPRLVRAIDAALALDPTFDHGAPLRLQGRFRGKAPWPYGDLPAARTALARAVELAPIVVNHLFFGDVLHAAGERDAARVQWQAAVAAPADESTRWSAELLRELARRRLLAAR